MIKGWTDVVRFPRLGEIRLGEKDERGIPKALDYFVVPPEVQEIYGPQPRELDVMFPHESLDVVMPAALKRYGDQWGLICRGDGEVATLSELYARKSPGEYGLEIDGQLIRSDGDVRPVLQGDDGRGWVQIPCSYKTCPHYQAQRCREVVLVNVLLPKVPGVLGVYTIATGSFHSYTNIKNALGMLRAMVGRISFIPLTLRVRMQEVHPEVGDKRIKRAVPVMYIDMTGMNMEKMIELAREERLALVHRSPVTEIEPPDENEKPELLYPPVPAPVPAIEAAAETGKEDRREKEDVYQHAATGGVVNTRSGKNVGGVDAEVQPQTQGNGSVPRSGSPAAEGSDEDRRNQLRKNVLEAASKLGRSRLKQALEAMDPFSDSDAWADDFSSWVDKDASEEDLQAVLGHLAAQMVLAVADDQEEVVRRVLAGMGIQIGEEKLDEALARMPVEQLRRVYKELKQGSKERKPASAGAGATAQGNQHGGTPAAHEVSGEMRVVLSPKETVADGRRFVSCRAQALSVAGLRQNMTVGVAADGQVGEVIATLKPGDLIHVRGKRVATNSIWAEEVQVHAPVAR